MFYRKTSDIYQNVKEQIILELNISLEIIFENVML